MAPIGRRAHDHHLAHRGRGVEHGWLDVAGATMYWSHADWATYQRWFDELGYEAVHDEFVAEGDGGHHLAVARAGAGSQP